jgi:hypothetical protein
MALHGHHRFIESATEAVQDAKQLALPLLMRDHPEDPWSSAALRALIAQRPHLDPVIGDALALIEDFELPFVEEEERLADAGVTLADDLLGFEEAMLEFERAFWLRVYEVYRADPGRWNLPEPVVRDLCEKHGLGSASVRAALRDQGFVDFAEAAPYLGADPTCPDCKLGVTKLLTAELRRRKEAQPS